MYIIREVLVFRSIGGHIMRMHRPRRAWVVVVLHIGEPMLGDIISRDVILLDIGSVEISERCGWGKLGRGEDSGGCFPSYR